MPYTIKELQSLPFWQNLQNADNIEYANKIEDLRIKYMISGSAADMTLRTENGIVLSYEETITDNNPRNKIIIRQETEILRTDSQLDTIIDREIKELVWATD